MLSISSPYDPAIALLEIQPREIKTDVHTYGEFINHMWYIYIMEYCSAIKNKVLVYATTQMNLKNYARLKKPEQMAVYYMILLVWNFQRIKIQRQKTEWLARTEGKD